MAEPSPFAFRNLSQSVVEQAHLFALSIPPFKTRRDIDRRVSDALRAMPGGKTIGTSTHQTVNARAPSAKNRRIAATIQAQRTATGTSNYGINRENRGYFRTWRTVTPTTGLSIGRIVAGKITERYGK
jgi:hypothetical protein